MISILRNKTYKLRQAVAVSLLLPLLLVALVPQGFMPAPTQEGWFTVTLCTTDGFRTVTLDENGQEVPDPAGQTDENVGGEHCLFSTFSLFETPIPTSVGNLLALHTSGIWPVIDSVVLKANTRQFPDARAPPSLA